MNKPCPTCNGTGTVEPGPPTSPESPQTLGVTADRTPDTDEGGPGTIEAGQDWRTRAGHMLEESHKIPEDTDFARGYREALIQLLNYEDIPNE